MPTSLNKLAAEFFGTFALVLAGTGAIVIDAVRDGAIGHVGIALTFGLIVMVMIYAVGDVSGAHFNPAVTLGFWAAGRLPARQVPRYVLAQLCGAMVASLTLLLLFGNVKSLGATLPAATVWQSFTLEALLTALLMYVILHVSTGPKEVGMMAGIAIGGTIGLEAMFAGPISGASMNPARSIAPAVVSGNITALWAYIVAPSLGSLLAVPAWRLTRNCHLPATAASASAVSTPEPEVRI